MDSKMAISIVFLQLFFVLTMFHDSSKLFRKVTYSSQTSIKVVWVPDWTSLLLRVWYPNYTAACVVINYQVVSAWLNLYTCMFSTPNL